MLGQARADGRVTVREVPPGYPAAAAGVVAGDEVLLIDGRDVRGMSPEAIHLALEGDPDVTSSSIGEEPERRVVVGPRKPADE